MKDLQTTISNWTGAAPRATQAWVQGIQSSNKDQAALAAAAQPRWAQGCADAAANNRFANGVTRRGTPYWKTQSEAKQGSYSTGYAAGSGNFGNAMGKLLPDIASIVSGLGPRGDITANLQRSQQLALALHQRKGQYKAS